MRDRLNDDSERTVVGGGKGTPSTSPSKKKQGQGKKAQEGTATLRRGKKGSTGVRVSVHGHRIDKVRFTDNGVPVGGARSPHGVRVPATPGVHIVTAHASFTDSTPPKTMTVRFRVPTPLLHPRRGSSRFTG